MLQLGGGDVAVRYGELRKQPLQIESIVFDKPAPVIEQHGGSINFRKAPAIAARPSTERISRFTQLSWSW